MVSLAIQFCQKTYLFHGQKTHTKDFSRYSSQVFLAPTLFPQMTPPWKEGNKERERERGRKGGREGGREGRKEGRKEGGKEGRKEAQFLPPWGTAGITGLEWRAVPFFYMVPWLNYWYIFLPEKSRWSLCSQCLFSLIFLLFELRKLLISFYHHVKSLHYLFHLKASQLLLSERGNQNILKF